MNRILVVEDAHSLRRDILEMLTFEGYEVTGAEDGLVGVQRARELLPDLIICDIMMPHMDGYGVLETLREDVVTASIPFVFLTARTDRVDIRQGMELGADDYLTKPFTAAELLQTVRTRLEKHERLNELAKKPMKDLQDNIILALPHELRTPLNVILGFSDLLMSDYDDMDAARVGEMARHMNSAALRLYRLIENFLIYANVEILKSTPEKYEALRGAVTEHPRAVIEYAALDKAQQMKREGDIQLDVEDTLGVQVVEEYLRKVVEELIDNALKFSEPNIPVQIKAYPERDRYVVCITDRGRGMTPEEIANIGAYMQFNRRFFEQQGSGLGLTIARRLVELHGGALSVTSVPDDNTTVRVVLKIAGNDS
jgi:two-component system, sensor histidine kinase and response regulator